MLECLLEGRRCNAKFLDADVERPLASASAIADGKECGYFSSLTNLTFENTSERTSKLVLAIGSSMCT